MRLWIRQIEGGGGWFGKKRFADLEVDWCGERRKVPLGACCEDEMGR